MTNITKNTFQAFESLFKELALIVGSEQTWEEKYKAVFHEPLAQTICEVGLMSIPDIQSTDEQEVLAFYTAVYHKFKYLEVYLGTN